MLTLNFKNREYIVIKKWVSPEFQDELFAHSRRIFDVTEIREKKLILGPIEKDTVTTLKVRDRKKDQMYVVRKKSTGMVRSKSSGFVCYTCKSVTVCVCDVGRGRSLRVVCVVCQSTTTCTCSRARSLRVVCVVCQSTSLCTCSRGRSSRTVCVVCRSTTVCICRTRSKSPAIIPRLW